MLAVGYFGACIVPGFLDTYTPLPITRNSSGRCFWSAKGRPDAAG